MIQLRSKEKLRRRRRRKGRKHEERGDGIKERKGRRSEKTIIVNRKN